jgi:hypothetical protein
MFTDLKLQTLMAEAKALDPYLRALLNLIASEFNSFEKRVKPIMGPLKTRERTISKLVDEKALDLLEIHDLSRGTLIFLNMEDMYSALERFREIEYINITKINDKFISDNFYKDINMNFFFWNSTELSSDQNTVFHLNLEVQFHLCHLYHAKLIDDPVYHVRRLTSEDNSIGFPNTFQIEVDRLFMDSSFQRELFGMEFQLFTRKYFSLLTCENFGEVYCQEYWENVMGILTAISLKLYTKAWENYAQGKNCNLDVFPPRGVDLLDYI